MSENYFDTTSNSSIDCSSVNQVVCICSRCRTISNLPTGYGVCTCGGSYHPISVFEYFDETLKKIETIRQFLKLPWYKRIFSKLEAS